MMVVGAGFVPAPGSRARFGRALPRRLAALNPFASLSAASGHAHLVLMQEINRVDLARNV